ncbi:MAG: ABC transporter permease [Deltaproteobacteria bacterium]|nr:ABC transporter permease [Deltaproteobacteria bacterium]
MSLPAPQSGAPAAEAGPAGGSRPSLPVVPPGKARGGRPHRFDVLVLLLGVVSAGLALGLAALLRFVLYHRFETSADLALISAIGLGGLLAALGGFGLGRFGRKLCVAEHQVIFLVTFVGLALLVTALHLARGLSPAPFSGEEPLTLGGSIGAAAGAAFGVYFAAFLGSSVAYLLGGAGALDLSFGYEWFIARRHLMSKKRTAFLSFITYLSILAVALGVWCLTVVLSVMSGFEDDLKQKILGTNTHAVVLRYASAFEDYEAIAEQVRGVRQVEGVSPFILGQVMVSSRKQVDGVLLKGVDGEHLGDVSDLPRNVEPNGGTFDLLARPGELDAYLKAHPEAGNPLPTLDLDEEPDEVGGLPEEGTKEAGERPVLPGIAIGRELSKSLRVFLGDTINVISPLSEEMGPMGPVPRTKAFRVATIFYTGMYEYDSKFAYIDLTEAQRFFDMEDAVTGLELKVDDIDDTRAITHRIVTELEGYPYYTKDWGEMNRNLFSALKLEKLVMAVILAFIVLVASFVILATLIMMVMEKGKEIAILKSMGVPSASVMKVFVLEGLVVGVIGTILGLALGLGTCAIIASGIIGLDPDVYYIDTLPVRIVPNQIVLVCIIAVVLSYLATIYPSVTASRVHPVEGLRDE